MLINQRVGSGEYLGLLNLYHSKGVSTMDICYNRDVVFWFMSKGGKSFLVVGDVRFDTIYGKRSENRSETYCI